MTTDDSKLYTIRITQHEANALWAAYQRTWKKDGDNFGNFFDYLRDEVLADFWTECGCCGCLHPPGDVEAESLAELLHKSDCRNDELRA